jgi:hypothetical protein
MRVYRDRKYRELWQELVECLLDEGYIKEAIVERVAENRQWHRNTVSGVFQALNLETFEHDGETYWRLSDKVTPILPNRGRVQRVAVTA